MTMTVTLTPQMEELVRDRLASGRYADDTAVIDEALRLLDDRDRFEYLRALVDEADAEVARGELVDWTPDFMERLMREAVDANRNGVPIHDDVLP